jgi:stearoyl-CoA desaturase (Delta-9 desaturase)
LHGNAIEFHVPMSPLKRYSTLAALVFPFLAFFVAVWLLWNKAVSWGDLALFVAFYAISVGGVTVGYHRLLTHRAFLTPKPVEYAFAIAGSVAVEGPVIQWVADHRKHHAHADVDGDPHSPHTGEGSKLGGLWHAHVGWMFRDTHAVEERYARELTEDRFMRFLDRYFIVIAGLGFAIPFAAGWWMHGSFEGALRGLLWGGLVRLFFVHHVTFAINSVCHFFGQRRFNVEDESTNVFWLALPSLGEAWHHNHHAFPRSARHGLRWWEIDLSAALIGALQRLGLAWNVTRIAPERQAQKLATREPVASS